MFFSSFAGFPDAGVVLPVCSVRHTLASRFFPSFVFSNMYHWLLILFVVGVDDLCVELNTVLK
jgi:hypothetical protein